MTATFQIGTKYAYTFIGDSDLHVVWQVLKRTPKTVTITDGRDTKVCRLRVYNDEELCNPTGTYSMAPILGAKDDTRLLGGKATARDLPPGTFCTSPQFIPTAARA